MKYTLDCINGGFANNTIRIRRERYELFEYYRLIRNAFVHSSIDRDRLQREFDRVAGLQQKVEADFGVVAPNEFTKLTFADHMLFTRIVKYIATDLCRLAPPLTAQELLPFLLSQPEMPSHPLARILGGASSPNPYRAGIRRFYRSKYKYDVREHQEAWDGLVDWIEKLPNKRQRRDMGHGNVVEYARSIFYPKGVTPP